MRRNSRFKNKQGKTISDKIIMYSVVGVAIVSAILVALFFYSKSLSDEVKNSTLTLEQMANISDNKNKDENETEHENTESASTDIGKTVEQSEKESNTTSEAENISKNTNNKTNITIEKTNTSPNKQTNIENKFEDMNKTNNIAKVTETKENKEETKKELSFQKPVEGDIVKEYARDNLVYSETLDEWITHLGIDIKAEKTTVVKSAEAGTIKSIKNDPRYGLTIVMQHEDGFETVYSNLLTSEFVVEGEKVEKGQSIGTVGNTAVFEISEEPHLHFEILKDSIQLDPNIYIK